MQAISGLLLSHHQPDQFDRCIRVGGKHVCRRCTILYPVAFTIMALSLSGFIWSSSLDRVLLFVLPIPVTAEFVLEHLGVLTYRKLRQIGTTLIAAPALGQGLARYLESPKDRLFWQMVLLFGGVCGLSVVVRNYRESKSAAKARQIAEESHPLLQEFADADAFRHYLETTQSSLQ